MTTSPTSRREIDSSIPVPPTIAGALRVRRHAAVTLVATPVSNAFYFALLTASSLSPTISNVLTASLIGVPTYFANRRWVWGKRSTHSWSTEVFPYWVLTVAKVAISSAAVWALDQTGAANGTLVAGSFLANGVVWVARYRLLNLVFRR